MIGEEESELGEALLEGKTAVIPTDTLYGLAVSALDNSAVERLYELKGRDRSKPFIILLDSLAGLERFGPAVTPETAEILQCLWPGPISIILGGIKPEYGYLDRGTGELAFRVPQPIELRRFLEKVGPIVAPSANPQGQPPAETVSEAQAYFGCRVDHYCQAGRLAGQASTLLRLTRGEPEIIRAGAGQNLLKQCLTSFNTIPN